MSAVCDIADFAADLPRFEDHERQEVKHITCAMAACRCGTEVTLEDGGPPSPASSWNAGCSSSRAAPGYPYHGARPT